MPKPPRYEVAGRPVAEMERGEVERMQALLASFLEDGSLIYATGVKQAVVPCMWCDTTLFSDVGISKHVYDKHPDVAAAIQADIAQGEPTMNQAVRKNASNRQVIAQLEAWGWQRGKTRQHDIQMLREGADGKKCEVWVRKENITTSNPHSIWAYIYSATGVSGEEFWRGPAPVVDLTAVAAATEGLDLQGRQAAQRARHISTRVLELLLAQDKALTTHYISQTLGFTDDEVGRACSYLVQRKLAVNVKRRMWQAVRTHHHQTNEGVDLTVNADISGTQMEPGPEPGTMVNTEPVVIEAPPAVPVTAFHAAQAPAEAPSDEEVLALLDMIAPKGFKAKDLPAIWEWVRATQNLIAGLG